MLKSLILLLLSVMIFTSCGDNGVEEDPYNNELSYVNVIMPDSHPIFVSVIDAPKQSAEKSNKNILNKLKTKKCKITLNFKNGEQLTSNNYIKQNDKDILTISFKSNYNNSEIIYYINVLISLQDGIENIKIFTDYDYNGERILFENTTNREIFDKYMEKVSNIKLN